MEPDDRALQRVLQVKAAAVEAAAAAERRGTTKNAPLVTLTPYTIEQCEAATGIPASHFDLKSRNFDAAATLSVPFPGVMTPIPDARVLDNMSKCRELLPQWMEESLQNRNPDRMPKRLTAVTAAAYAKERAMRHNHQEAGLAAREPIMAGILRRIETQARAGPTLWLAGRYRSGARVHVATRHAHGIRGTIVGRLHAFDARWNLILADAEEAYTIRTRVWRAASSAFPHVPIAHPSALACEPGRWRWRQEHRRRELPMVFIRGEHVVLIARASDNPEVLAAVKSGDWPPPHALTQLPERLTKFNATKEKLATATAAAEKARAAEYNAQRRTNQSHAPLTTST